MAKVLKKPSTSGQNGKGDSSRITDYDNYRINYDSIFKKIKPLPVK